MNGVNEKVPPPIPKFDRSKYRYPNDKQVEQLNIISNNGKQITIFVYCIFD
jgi:hypothetical protein